MKLVKSLLFSLTLFLLFPAFVFSQKLPAPQLLGPAPPLLGPAPQLLGSAPTAYVSDFAEVLSPEFEDSLNQNLTDFDSKTGNQIAVVTVKSLDGLTVEEFAINLAEKWGVGQKAKDSGLLFLFAPNEKKVRIEIGYGLEHLLTDGQSGYILDTEFIPEHKNGNYEQAILNTITKIQFELNNPDQENSPASSAKPSNIPVYLPFLIIFLVYLFSYLSRSKEFVTGAVFGFAGGLLINGFITGLFLGIFGLVLDFILSKNYRRTNSLGLPTGFRSTLGGFKSSGHSGGGGGFGGFGGGSFGGGGSSRSL